MVESVLAAIIAVALGAGTPYWVDPEVHEGTAECGSCGAELAEYRLVLDYANEEWGPSCDYCFALFATETLEHRQMVELELAEELR